MNRTDKKSILIHLDLLGSIELMTDEEAGMILRAIKAYWTETDYQLPRELQFAFLPIKQAFDRDWESYIKTVEKNRENGQKGGRPKKSDQNQDKPKKPTGFSENPKNPDKDNDNDKGKDNDINKTIPRKIPFAEFYSKYPVKKSKAQAEKNWSKLPIDIQQAAIDGISHYLSVNNPQFYVHPSTYLSHRRWEDEESQSEQATGTWGGPRI